MRCVEHALARPGRLDCTRSGLRPLAGGPDRVHEEVTRRHCRSGVRLLRGRAGMSDRRRRAARAGTAGGRAGREGAYGHDGNRKCGARPLQLRARGRIHAANRRGSRASARAASERPDCQRALSAAADDGRGEPDAVGLRLAASVPVDRRTGSPRSRGSRSARTSALPAAARSQSTAIWRSTEDMPACGSTPRSQANPLVPHPPAPTARRHSNCDPSARCSSACPITSNEIQCGSLQPNASVGKCSAEPFALSATARCCRAAHPPAPRPPAPA